MVGAGGAGGACRFGFSGAAGSAATACGFRVSGANAAGSAAAGADAVVCGGGHGMLTKALTAGKPVVVVPGGGDQWELANRVARQGSGVLVRPATADAIRDGVRRVLDDPSYARAARSAADGAHRVADPVLVCEAYR